MKTMDMIQNFVDQWGIGMSVEKLADKVYWFAAAQGCDAHAINTRYVSVNGESFRFIKSKKQGRWIVKPW